MNVTLPREGLPALFEALRARGYAVVGPTVRDGAIAYEELESTDQLPFGWTDEQAPGRYRLRRRGDRAAFGYAVGPHSWKQELFPAKETLFQAELGDDGVIRTTRPAPAGPRAFLGVRACELAAISIQDQVFRGGRHLEPRYATRRDNALFVAVNCAKAGELCFCTSMGTGPTVEDGADLVLTELEDGFVVRSGSERGDAILADLPTRPTTAEEGARARAQGEAVAASMGRRLDTHDLPGLLFGNLDHPRWTEVAQRCVSCGNCTSVCPTCFCSTTVESSDLDGAQAQRTRQWDSCFTGDHSRIHGAHFRPDTEGRYKQWLTHKFGSWVSQFGTSGCVGCGRCVAWCPVGIDVVEELGALRVDAAPSVPMPAPPSHAVSRTEDLVPQQGRVLRRVQELADTATLHVEAPSVELADHGQFHMIGLPGIGEVPISVSGRDEGHHVFTVRALGAVTAALVALQPGDTLQIRGPYGVAWPLASARGRPLLLVAGGIGLAPLRTALRAALDDPASFPDVRLLVGSRSPADRLYPDELARLARNPRLTLVESVDHAGPEWSGHVGFVTRLIDASVVPAGSSAFICGPEPMMKYARDGLHRLGVPDDRIFLSMERHMKCAAGFCGRCQYGPWFVCQDGPVFSYDTIAPIFGREGF